MTSPKPTFPTSPGQSATGGDASIVEQTQEKLGQVVDQAQQSAGQVTQQVKEQATSQIESQKDRAVDSLVTVAQALRQTGQHLHEQKQNDIAGYVDQAAERVESLTNHVRARDIPQLLDDTEDMARSNPGLFLGAALTLGFLGARFLMSSGQRARAQRGYGLPGGAPRPGSQYAPQPGSQYAPRTGSQYAPQSGSPYAPRTGSSAPQTSSPYAPQTSSPYGRPAAPSGQPSTPGAQSSPPSTPPSAVHDPARAGMSSTAGGIDGASGTPAT